MKISKFGEKIGKTSGIGQLMKDLGQANASDENVLMLGGGNPAHIPAIEKYFRKSIAELLECGDDFECAIGNYDPPQGNVEFIEAVAGLLANEFGWDIGPENIALTLGSQSAFFILFNIFAGSFEGGIKKKILFPLAPEYIGYCDVGLEDDMFVSVKPSIEHIEEHIFKYRVDFSKLEINEEVGAICVSRPTNPTGNVLTDTEIEKLNRLARENNIPLIIDNAYGTPFPNIIYTDARPLWDESTIVCMSLSKFGLPATRTGIVIARSDIIKLVSEMNALMSLAPAGLGAAIAKSLVKSGEIIKLSREIVRPFYQQKSEYALKLLSEQLDTVNYHIHKPEGSFFLWLWLEDFPVTDVELYWRLKDRGVLVVPGHYFFPGLKEDWPHKHHCIRINYSQDEETVGAGLKIIAEEVKRAYGKI